MTIFGIFWLLCKFAIAVAIFFTVASVFKHAWMRMKVAILKMQDNAPQPKPLLAALPPNGVDALRVACQYLNNAK